MPPTRRVLIESLAPTGEGVVHGAGGVGFVAGALPGEVVEAEILEARKRFWKGRVRAVEAPSPDRVSGGHAEGCAGCDWAHVEPAHAREWKRRLFLDTMQRLGRLAREDFGSLPIAPSPEGYRLRCRLHVAGRGAEAMLGFFAPGTHRIAPAEGCEALSGEMRRFLPALTDAVRASGAAVSEIALLESRDAARRVAEVRLGQAAGSDGRALARAIAPLVDGLTVLDGSGSVASRSGDPALWISAGGREFPVEAGVFFQTNRFLLDALAADATKDAAAVSPGRALDAFGGIGLFAGALLGAGHAVESVESDQSSVRLAADARRRWDARSWTITRSDVLAFIGGGTDVFDVAVVDPPRAGLGLTLAAALPRRVGRRLLYVSCDPATLARDLSVLTKSGFAIAGARLYDLFSLTHRVEAAVVLDRAGG